VHIEEFPWSGMANLGLLADRFKPMFENQIFNSEMTQQILQNSQRILDIRRIPIQHFGVISEVGFHISLHRALNRFWAHSDSLPRPDRSYLPLMETPSPWQANSESMWCYLVKGRDHGQSSASFDHQLLP
jgi:hypothetical protein